ncbi:glucose-1-phosphate adenylyltransferase [Streptococcus azizii]|uniref:Glucose-1-phosphate adenylyltransferase n=1 Tax=Streptococcus azizii TaxID=1579424 RepID=A0AB36JQ78_9STRE|nr:MULTISPECIES: glucose-1-phosphate adenylyltransferase [Streptococcus]MBF0776462.1 glucose-1-phosphate adenylyltransferase [Streptococcus sp. 19428wD3_AN2]ONK26830.1 glucose-1-phosphate adenylyltransferase [Streptococcus azizii]ONK27273.1 glucose-1-phosphate adenylyltransferase [Streptococcus azizii]ONK27781.1 glucose-1-phosphate adenylyltransferase [Streptococcus azizii]TFU82941.1 glucose-1-phosphate adenylyltransferase [Streptococcus sp. AN2]
MAQNKLLAMILAGGRGTRLEGLTKKVAKPAVAFGGKYRIIDFPLSNCANSGIDIVGVLTQYEPVLLNSYVAQSQRWGLDVQGSGVFVLPPSEKIEGFGLYKGTADAITQNIDFVDLHDPEYVLILSGDHIYKMNYDKLLDTHIQNEADATIAVIEVPMKEASRFGIMNTDSDYRIEEFEEKPAKPKSNLASMGIYIFTWKTLRKYLLEDDKLDTSSHDFGHDIIPKYLADGKRLYAHPFRGYWKDVGTVNSLWESNMDLIEHADDLDLSDPSWRIYSEDSGSPAQVIGSNATVRSAYIDKGAIIEGRVEHSVISTDVVVNQGAFVKNSVLLPGAVIGDNVQLDYVIVAENVKIAEGVKLSGTADSILLIDKNVSK